MAEVIQMNASAQAISGQLSSQLVATNFLVSKPFWQESFVQFPESTIVTTALSALLYGHDVSLIETRALVLRAAGFSVYTASDQADADRIIINLPLDILIVGHSVPFAEANALLSLAHTLRPLLKCLVMITDGPSPFAEYMGDKHRTSDGPGALIAKVRDLLRSTT
jgi:hypothetical protein